jgi:indolepyruvate decarboxylase
MVFEPCAPVVPLREEPHEMEALSACVGEILERLEQAKSPVLMVGVEIRRYGLEHKVTELACKLGLPVVTSFMGRGLLADTDAPLIGTYMGVAGPPKSAAWLRARMHCFCWA